MRTSPPEVVFPLRVDRNGYRPVYKLGNERGDCSFGCRFCGVRRSIPVTSAQNVAAFDALHAEYSAEIDGAYHPAVFNRGNVTDPDAFSPSTLDHVLAVFERDPRVVFVSLNSRERTATSAVLDGLAGRKLPFPVHFIFGQESFNSSAARVLGKNTEGELERFVERLRPYNPQHDHGVRRRYVFGLDVNLVFLPELYMEVGASRRGREARIIDGLADDLRELLRRVDPLVPVEVNIHPYYEVESLPYEKADLFLLLRAVAPLRSLIDDHNRQSAARRVSLFLGVVLLTDTGRGGAEMIRVQRLQAAVDGFNRNGTLPTAAMNAGPVQ